MSESKPPMSTSELVAGFGELIQSYVIANELPDGVDEIFGQVIDGSLVAGDDDSQVLLTAFRHLVEIVVASGPRERPLSDVPSPSCNVSVDGTLLELNSAWRAFVGDTRTLDLMPFDEQSRKKLLKLLADPPTQTEIIKCQLGGDDTQPVLLLVSAKQGSGINIQVAEHRWDETLGRRLAAAFGLTDAELSVLHALSEGYKPPGIAKLRGTSLETIRVQAKAIYRKTRTKGQAELAGLVSNLFALPRRGSGGDLAQTENLRIASTDGREIEVLFGGPEHGTPVLFLHGSLHGPAFNKPTRDALRQANVRLICPLRAGFGGSDPSPDSDVVATAIGDCRAVIDHFELDDIPCLGIGLGGFIGAQCAIVLNTRLTRTTIVACNGPLLPNMVGGITSPGMRAMVELAQSETQLLDFVMRVWLEGLQRGSVANGIRGSFPPESVDARACDDPDFIEFLTLNWREIMFRQGVDSGIRDMRATYSPIASWPQGVVPTTFVHGEQDPVMSSAVIERWAKTLPNTQITTIPGGGHFVFATHPREILAAALA